MSDVSYHWVYLCSDPRRLGITLRLLPRDGMIGLREMSICYMSHMDPPELADSLYEAVVKHAPAWLNWCIRDLTPGLANLAPSNLLAYCGAYNNRRKPRWNLGFKLLLPLYFEPPFLYTDDDVLVIQDPQPLMTNSFGTSGNFKFFKDNRRLFPLAGELATAFFDRSTSLVQDELFRHPDKMASLYDERILDAGVWFIKYPDDWDYRIKRFAELPYLSGLDETSHEFRRQDQRFLTMFGILHGWDVLNKAPQRRNCYSHPSKFTLDSLVKGTYFVHYKTGRHKADWMTALETFLLERP